MNPMHPLNTVPAGTIGQPVASTLATNKVIRNTYMLLSLTLVFSAVTAGGSATA